MKTEDRHKHSRTAVFLEEDYAEPLRDLAASLNLYITRGIGSGKIGNVKSVVVRLAEVYQRYPATIIDLLQPVEEEPGSDVPA